MALSILSSAFLRLDGGVLTNPNAGEAFVLALAWGPGEGATAAPTLAIVGGTIDTSYAGGFPVNNPLTYGGARPVFAGWHPDNTPVFLESYEAAWGLWKVTLPAVQAYTATLSGITGDVTMNAQAAPAAGVYPTVRLLQYRIIGDTPSQLVELSYTGNYPAGGLTLEGAQLGLLVPLFATINDTATYRFRWDKDDKKLKVFDSDSEVSGAITFTTKGLFQAQSR